MSEMVDRVARAIADELARQDECHDGPALSEGTLAYIDQGEVNMLAVARAAIEAMRNPTEEMIEASARAGFGGDRIFPTAYWNAGIEAALKD